MPIAVNATVESAVVNVQAGDDATDGEDEGEDGGDGEVPPICHLKDEPIPIALQAKEHYLLDIQAPAKLYVADCEPAGLRREPVPL